MGRIHGSGGWGHFKGLAFGVIALAATGEQGPFESIDFLILDPPRVERCMFLGLHLAFGLTVSDSYWVLNRTLPPAGDTEQPAYLIITSLGVLPLFLLIPLFTVPSFCECEPSFGFLATILVMITSTAVRHAASFLGSPARLSRIATITGYGSLVALLTTVGLRQQVPQILRILEPYDKGQTARPERLAPVR